MKNQSGFTLIELSIVLVVIGLIIGMGFKGKDLIDSAKTKSLQTQIMKIQTAFNIYYERNGFYPGLGLNGSVRLAGDNPANYNTTQFRADLTGSGILSPQELKSPLGATWGVYAVNGKLMLDLDGANTDAKYVCQLDRLMDDGVPGTGTVQAGANNGGLYTADSDCYSNTVAGKQSDLWVQLLP
ncbi:MAG: prepilin-type N-terminal cleavage/methylation domain-containing protein [Laribacter sp.]|nr:prepilin-type N-terminal cleavage/methylation domain-containing protein [Laribacter sp.]MBP9527886.1 prepilin-type N-terminal cleavage/methylation domain-containing protein [Laribacter sp.]MBP9609168.1 prepilin-type N-terminal cleavage/methylation domain-containing protein [Laribacter sp.]